MAERPSAVQAVRCRLGVAWVVPRFQPPLIKPCMRFSRTRLAEAFHPTAVGVALCRPCFYSVGTRPVAGRTPDGDPAGSVRLAPVASAGTAPGARGRSCPPANARRARVGFDLLPRSRQQVLAVHLVVPRVAPPLGTRLRGPIRCSLAACTPAGCYAAGLVPPRPDSHRQVVVSFQDTRCVSFLQATAGAAVNPLSRAREKGPVPRHPSAKF